MARSITSYFLVTIALIAVFSSWATPVMAFTPESKEVRQMIDRALAYMSTRAESRWGGKCLLALPFVKERQSDHPKVMDAVTECQKMAARKVPDLANNTDVYSLSLGIIFLCDLDADLYRNEIARILEALYVRQLKNGAWGYPADLTGDTSMTQYAVLAFWSAHRVGIEIRKQPILDVCTWLVRTQDASGGFGYHPIFPEEENADRLNQQEVRESTSVGGLGSLYVCATLLGANPMVNRSTGRVQDIPAALIPVPGRGEGSLDVRVSRGLANEIKRGLNDGNKWLSSNFTIQPERYVFYYLYALERYQAFRTLGEGKPPEAEPNWYNMGVKYLATRQLPEGGWSSGEFDSIEDQLNTAFAVLFLMRSTQKSIQQSPFGDGLLIGGHGLPKDTRRIRMVDGRIVGQFEQRSAAAIARILSDPDSPDFEALSELEDGLMIDADAASEDDQEQLRRLIVAGNANVRAIALRALSSQRNLDNVPVLIHALASDEPATREAANVALCRLSRKFDGFGSPSMDDSQQHKQTVEAWKQWYRSVRPHAKFIDQR